MPMVEVMMKWMVGESQSQVRDFAERVSTGSKLRTRSADVKGENNVCRCLLGRMLHRRFTAHSHVTRNAHRKPWHLNHEFPIG